ncbi:sister chromatid cohesion C-terminus-domain-containing protein [Myxozyma melibiosi]|uniref:Sister chromatid cohesion protein n=1 Tax=Myxozyma melibiosi TaxID=54550 RepID=A0ABR1FFF1_9ASCO
MRPIKFEVPPAFASLPSGGSTLNSRVQAFELRPFTERLLTTSDIPYQYSVADNERAPVDPSNSISLDTMLQTLQNNPSSIPVQIPELPTDTPQNGLDPTQTTVSAHDIPGTSGVEAIGPLPKKRKSEKASSVGVQHSQAAFSNQVPETFQQPYVSADTSIADSSMASRDVYPSSAAPTSPLPSTSPDTHKRKTAPDYTDALVFDDPTRKSQVALEGLTNLIENVFEADDNLATDTSGVRGEFSSVWAVDGPTDDPVLSNEYLIRLESVLKRVISFNVYPEISIDDILRLQKICLKSVRLGSALHWNGAEGLLEADTAAVYNDVSTADNSLKAAKLIFLTMLGSREEKQICSEDIIKETLDLLSGLIDGLFIPLIPPVSDMESLLPFKKLVLGLLQEMIRVINLIYQLLELQDVSETVISRFEFVCIGVIFAETPTFNKDSYLGIANIENLRVAAMDVLAQIFACQPEQRTFLLNEILTSLEKLPVSRQTARQYKLVGGGHIQLVTALILRLVQTAGSLHLNQKFASVSSVPQGDGAEDNDQQSDERAQFIQECARCNSEALKSSNDVISFLIERVLKSKSRDDQPYRGLLDLFTEDFLVVLESPEWPGAEVLLRSLAMRMISFANNEKEPALVCTMAIDILGTIGEKLLLLRHHDSKLPELTASASQSDMKQIGKVANSILLYLHKLRLVDSTAGGSFGYFMTAWVALLASLDVEAVKPVVDGAIEKLMQKASSNTWAAKENFEDETPAAMKAKYTDFSRLMPLYKLYDRIFSEILVSLNSERITSRTKGLRVLSILVAVDPTILMIPIVLSNVSSRLRDQSAQVRDAAVDTIGKFILTKPEVTQKYYLLLCERANDTGTAVRKRVVKLLRDICVSTSDVSIEVEITDRLLRRTEDIEESISELAQKTLEDIYFGPTKKSAESDELGYKTEVDGRVQILLQVRERGNKDPKIVKLMQNLLTGLKKKESDGGVWAAISKVMVENLIESVIDWTPGKKVSLQSLFGLLALFATANKSLFEAEQLVALQSYLQHESPKDDLATYYVLVVFRNILPTVGAVRSKFSTEVQQILLSRLTKFNLRELAEAVPCLWDISLVLKDTRRLAATTVSCLKMIAPNKAEALSGHFKSYEQDSVKVENKVIRLLHLLGMIGRYFNLEEHIAMFQSVPGIKGRSVVEMIVLTLQVFACAQCVPAKIKKIAIRNIGNMAITHPQIYLSKMALRVLDDAWESDDRELKNTVIRMLIEFVTHDQEKADQASRKRGNSEETVDIGVLKGDTHKFANDGVSASLSQRYLENILAVAIDSEDDYALSATLLLEKIVTQGFANPRSCVPTLIALETSMNPTINALAVDIHRKLHSKHESLIDGIYVEGVRRAYEYRRLQRSSKQASGDESANEDDSGVIVGSNADLMPLYSLVRQNRNSKRKLLTSVVRSFDFDPGKLVAGVPVSEAGADDRDLRTRHLGYVRYVGYCLARLDLTIVEEPYLIVHGLDKIIGSTGMTVLMAVSDLLGKVSAPDTDAQQLPADLQQQQQSLAISSAIIYTIYQLRQHIRQAYSLTEHACQSFTSSSKPSKEYSKPPATKSSSIAPLKLDWICLQNDFRNPAVCLRVLATVRELMANVEVGEMKYE